MIYKIQEKPVIFKNSQRENLWGMLSLPKTKKRAPAVILVHGFNGSKSARKFVKIGRKFSQSGIAVLRFDFAGCGDSEGDFKNMSIRQEVEDLNAAYKFLVQQPQINKNRIGLLGYSLGGLITCLFQVRNAVAKTLVLVAPAINQGSLMKIWCTPKEIKKWRQRGYMDTPKYRIGIQYLNEAEDYTPIMSNIKIPTLIIHGKNDEDVPISFSKKLLKFLKKRKMIIVERADHNLESFLASNTLINYSSRWFKKYL